MKRIWKYLVTAALSLLGFASCEEIRNGFGFGLCMYGEPHADFKTLGTVTDEDGKPIEGIRVAVTKHDHYENNDNVIYDQNDWYYHDTLYTDSKGEYLLQQSVFRAPQEVTVVFEDIDGEENGGEFESAEATPELKKVKEGDGNWYIGMFEAQADVTLKKK